MSYSCGYLSGMNELLLMMMCGIAGGYKKGWDGDKIMI